MVSSETFLLIYDISLYANIACVILSLVLLKYQAKRDRLIIIYLILSVLCDLFSEMLPRVFDIKNTNYIANLWTFMEFITLTLFYSFVRELKLSRKYHIKTIFAFTIVCLIIFLQFKSVYDFVNLHKIVSALYYSTLSIYLFYQFLVNVDNNLIRTSIFWQNTGIFFYFTGNILIFLMLDYLLSEDFSFLNVGWGIHNMLTIIKTVCFATAFIINFKYRRLND